MNMLTQATYIWLDGAVPTRQLRSKTRILQLPENQIKISDFPEWGYDGSSTNQAEGGDSDLVLEPVCFVEDPLAKSHYKNYLVLCEVLNADGSAHETNTRAPLRDALNENARAQDPWVGFEQEYTLFANDRPLGWPENGFPAPQGPFYCGIGADNAFGRELVTKHTEACLDAGLMIFGTNAEVMPGQWEFQMGYRGIKDESADPLTVSDHLWLARWLLLRLGEDYGVSVSFEPKPVKGDWNGAGKHTNFSTKAMRDKNTGRNTINEAIENLSKKHDEHISVYGDKLDERLTGAHETASIHQFSYGVSDRGASIRIPRSVATDGFGYLEDRRPRCKCRSIPSRYDVGQYNLQQQTNSIREKTQGRLI